MTQKPMVRVKWNALGCTERQQQEIETVWWEVGLNKLFNQAHDLS
jgi:hypothetical protein